MKTRNSNIELLRIISMVLIVLTHYTFHNGVVNSSLDVGINRYILEIITIGNIGLLNYMYVMGYFNSKMSQPFKLKKLVLLILKVMFYSLVIYFIFVLFGLEKISFKGLVQNLFPISFKKYWFITAYLLTYILCPFINKLLNNLNQKEHLSLIGIGILIFSVLTTLFNKDYYCNDLVLFILCYIIGGYFAKYNCILLNNKKRNKKIFITCITILLLSNLVFDLVGMKYSLFATHSIYFYGKKSIVTFILSILVFNYVINKKEKNIPKINIISKYVLGVYLISDNYLIRSVLWTDILNVKGYVNSNFLIFHIILSVLSVFIVCWIIDFICENTIGRLNSKIYQKIESKLKNKKLFVNIKNIGIW